MKRVGEIVQKGMGGFLNPPTHPEHTQSVQGRNFGMPLSVAATSDALYPELRDKVQKLLSTWKPLPLKDPAVQKWICQVMGYFKGCYSGQDKDGNKSWNVQDLRIMPDADPFLNKDLHAGVHHIRKFYPEFRLLKRHIKNAYWGKDSV